jgi:hypothetical protein
MAGQSPALENAELQKASSEWRRARRELIALEWAFERSRSDDVAQKVMAAQARLETRSAELHRLARREPFRKSYR